MLNLDDLKWSELTDSQGSAQTIPALLKHLMEFPKSTQSHDLWDRLVHQNKGFQASYAATPYLIFIASQVTPKDRLLYLLLIGAIETCRPVSLPIPKELENDYFHSLLAAWPLTIECLQLELDDDDWIGLCATLAAIRGKHKVAEKLFEIVS